MSSPDVNKPHGWDAELPLHWAISERAPLFIIEALLDIFPEGECRQVLAFVLF
jgi:hypothetical protein